MPERFVSRPLLGLFLVNLLFLLPPDASALTQQQAHNNKKKAAQKKGAPAAAAARKATPALATATTAHRRSVAASASSTAVVRRASLVRPVTKPVNRYSPWTEPSFGEPTVGDIDEGDDPVIRKAAVDALGPFNGALVVVDPQNGRVMTMVNQKLALKGGHTPCSTIKLVTSLAAIKEGLIDRTTPIQIGKRLQMDMTEALAISNNAYFARLGTQLGFNRINMYARLYGIGEKAGWNIEGEQPGSIQQLTPAQGGVGMMTSYGNGIHVTPLELAALVSAIANNGTLYYLQYPRTAEEIQHFQPRVKRQLDIASMIQEIRPGMQGAVEFGTARRAGIDAPEQILGKTGTCSEFNAPTTHLGWFASFNEPAPGTGKRLVAVVMLTGGKQVNGPIASGVAGSFFRNLARMQYFGGSVADVTASGNGSGTSGTGGAPR